MENMWAVPLAGALAAASRRLPGGVGTQGEPLV